MNFPLLVFAMSFLLLSLAAAVGDIVRSKIHPLVEEERDDFGIILSATLTLLGLLIGFTFCMAISRHDQRKNYEEAEANAIGTEYVRADLLPPGDRARVRELLRMYVDERVLFYTTRDRGGLAKINTDTAELQNELWATVRPAATGQPTAVVALVISGMNDVLNSQGYTQAAWWNRIPLAAWALMAAIAVCCNLDRKSTRLNSSHPSISYAVFCLKKKKTNILPCSGVTHPFKLLRLYDETCICV